MKVFVIFFLTLDTLTQLPMAMRFPRVIAQTVTPTRLHACVACVNGKPVPISAKRGRDSHETALQLRRLEVGDTLPIIEDENWTPTKEVKLNFFKVFYFGEIGNCWIIF